MFLLRAKSNFQIMNTNLSDSSIKIHHFLSQAGVCSRRQAEILIKDKRVFVNQNLAKIGQRINPTIDRVFLDKKPISIQNFFEYYLVDKPLGVISTTKDELNRQTVLSLLPKNIRRMYPVGRLDADTTGLILITNDGELTHVLTHPSFKIRKSYLVKTDRPLSALAINHLEKGVLLKEGKTNPCLVKINQPDEIIISINQGWNRQIRRMIERVGYEVVALRRLSFGPFNIEQLNGKRCLKIELNQTLRNNILRPNPN